ncbi:FAD-dependent oxidoreductase, partial [Lonsdalea britannica]|uniref:FAD-dependent oxidoreductase n=1 Tax=Lonsdalea britannica TaxID=1082704 RepID=UPI0026EDB5A9
MHFDAVIVGGGMVGAAAALGLAQNGFQVALVEQEAPPAFDAESPPDLRLSAIGYASVALLRQLGAWANVEQMRSAPYRRLETWEWDSARVAFDASELSLPELGFMVENRVLQRALWQSLENTPGVTFLCPRHLKQLDYDAPVWRVTLDDDAVIETTLVVGADGAQSRVRQWAGIGVSGWQYRQSCMLISVRTEGPQQDVTWQQFT